MTELLSPPLPERPVDPDWLLLREPADADARGAAASAILEPLLQCLPERLSLSGAPGLRVVDLGAGTGANLRWLAPRLAGTGSRAGLGQQHWTLIDHDPRLHAWGPSAFTTVHADVADLGDLLPEASSADLVTAAALLDLLNSPQLTAVVNIVRTQGIPALFSLNVTGAVRLDPPHPLDDALAKAFDAHQRREGRLGPDAGLEAASRFRRFGWRVIEAQTPWRLNREHGRLIEAWLEGRADAAAEWKPQLAGQVADWLERRRQQCRNGQLTAVTGHVDVLAIPPAS